MQELVPVAVEGTRNVINAAADMGVRRVVFTSSYGAVHMDPNRSPDAVLDETCWSDYEFCKKTDVSQALDRIIPSFARTHVCIKNLKCRIIEVAANTCTRRCIAAQR